MPTCADDCEAASRRLEPATLPRPLMPPRGVDDPALEPGVAAVTPDVFIQRAAAAAWSADVGCVDDEAGSMVEAAA